jgi:hypothetical protein
MNYYVTVSETGIVVVTASVEKGKNLEIGEKVQLGFSKENIIVMT